jgi:hypothetical protein
MVYRGVPRAVVVIRPGDWVSTDVIYAESHADAMADQTGQPWHVLSLNVPESELEWAEKDDEWFADTGERREFFYRPRTES